MRIFGPRVFAYGDVGSDNYRKLSKATEIYRNISKYTERYLKLKATRVLNSPIVHNPTLNYGVELNDRLVETSAVIE